MSQKKFNLIIYLHGFKASQLAQKGVLLKAYFKDDFINPSLPISPKLQYLMVEQLIEAFSQFYDQITLIGSSMGGFLSLCLLNRFPNLCKVILVNPAVNLDVTLLKYLGENEDFGGTKFILNQTHIQEMQNLKVKEVDQKLQESRVLLLLQTGDQVLDYKEAMQLLPHAQTDVTNGGDHSFINFDSKFEKMKEFINQKVL